MTAEARMARRARRGWVLGRLVRCTMACLGYLAAPLMSFLWVLHRVVLQKHRVWLCHRIRQVG